MPHMRFVFLRPGLCLHLPPDPASRRQPLVFGSWFPSSGSIEDLHLQVHAPCRAHKEKAHQPVGSVGLYCQDFSYLLMRLLATPTSPSRPAPSKSSVPGSGTEGVPTGTWIMKSC